MYREDNHQPIHQMKKHTSTIIVIVGVILVFASWGTFAFTNFGYPVAKWGVFGDKFGTLNCLFTGLALVGLVAGYWHEREGSAAREKEQRELIQVMSLQAKATIIATRISIQAARSEALRDRAADAKTDASPAGLLREAELEMSAQRSDKFLRDLLKQADELLKEVPS